MKFIARTFVPQSSPEMLFPFLAYLMWTGAFLYYQTGNFMFISISSGISSISSACLTIFIFRRKEINLIRLVTYMSMFWYFLPLTYYKFIDLRGLLPVTEADMAGSVVLITTLLSIGWFFSFFLNFKVTFPQEEPAFLKSRDLLLSLIPLCILQALLIVTGAWTYETTHVSQPSPVAMFAKDVTLGIAPLVAYNFGLLTFRQRTVWQWLFFITVMSLEGVFFLIEERRTFMVVIVLSAITFSMGRIKDMLSFRQLLYMAVLALPLGFGISQANKLFYKVRLASYEFVSEPGKSHSISDYLDAMNHISVETLASELDNNVAVRPYIISAVGIVQKYASGHLYGEELLYDFIRVIPSPFYSGKEQFIANYSMPEVQWNKELGVPFDDYANSLMLDGYVDFSYFGFLLYVTICSLSFLIIYKLYSIRMNTSLKYLCAFSFLLTFMMVETSCSAFFVMTRDFIILYIFMGSLYLFLELTERLSKTSMSRKERSNTEHQVDFVSHNPP
jgi:hypothetical protein